MQGDKKHTMTYNQLENQTISAFKIEDGNTVIKFYNDNREPIAKRSIYTLIKAIVKQEGGETSKTLTKK